MSASTGPTSRAVRVTSVLIPAGVVLLACSVPAALNVAMTVLGQRRSGHVLTPWSLFVAAALPWYVWALVTPLVMRLVRRRPSHPPFALGSIAAHAALCVVATLAFVIAALEARRAVGLGVGGQSLWALAVGWSPLTVPTYAAILGIAYAVLYARRARDEALERAILAEQLTRAQLNALRVQLHPHFLFNTLNTVAALVRDRDADTAVRLIADLGGILRELLRDQDRTEVSLRAELELTGRYLAIEQMRFGDRMRVEERVDQDVLDAVVPPLILQPIVENAIRHGIAHLTTPGTIRIEAAAQADTVVLTVRDDGPIGPPPHQPAVSADGAGLGLANTRARLASLYGGRARFDLRRTDAGLTQATITIPLTLRPGTRDENVTSRGAFPATSSDDPARRAAIAGAAEIR